jgi:hypothetical protein
MLKIIDIPINILYSSRPGLNTFILTLSLLTSFFSTGPNLDGGHKIYVTFALINPIGTYIHIYELF